MSVKGKMVIGQSGGPTVAINASLAGALREASRHPEIEAVYGSLNGVLGVINEHMVDLGLQTPVNLDLLARTPSSILGSCRYKLAPDDCDRILNVFRTHDIRYFFYIGGNDSMDTAHKVAETAAARGYEMAIVGIPKTIDNDLPFTDHCPGSGSAARFTAMSVRDAGRDEESIGEFDPVKVMEIMGREAGWLTASSALAREGPDDAPQLIYTPERTLDMDRFIDDVQRCYDRLGYVLVAAAETLRDATGEVLGQTIGALDSFGHPQRSGVGDFLCRSIKERLGLKARFDKAGTLQRSFMAAASSIDLHEAALVGETAVREALKGVTDRMITIERVSDDPYESRTGLVELARVANAERFLPEEYLSPSGNDVTDAFIAYARPLIGDPLSPYARLAHRPVQRLVNP